MSHSRPSINGAAPIMLLLLVVTGAAAESDAAGSLLACSGIDDDHARLACYDRASGRTSTTATTATTDAKRLPAASTPSSPMTAPTAPRPAAPSGTDGPSDTSLLTRAWSFDPDSARYLIKLYRPNYLNPVRWQSRTNDRPFSPLFSAVEVYDGELDQVEATFQISFKTRVWASDNRRWGAWFAYTQQSFWQVYNGEISSPFRDTNYEPELKLAWQPRLSWGGFDWQLLSLGYTHQSNGRADPISRSWDRLVAEIGIEKGNFALLLRPWVRIDDDSDDSDNPDITDYYGHGDLTAVYKWRGNSFSLMARGNLAERKGALRVSWMSPPLLGPLRGYVVGFTGYGDTLLDYNFKQNAVSVGLALNDLLDR